MVHFEVNEYSEHTLTPEVSVPKVSPVSTKTAKEKKLKRLGYHVFFNRRVGIFFGSKIHMMSPLLLGR